MQTQPLLLLAWETSESICSLARKASRKQFRAVCEAFDQRQCLEENTSSIVIGRFQENLTPQGGVVNTFPWYLLIYLPLLSKLMWSVVFQHHLICFWAFKKKPQCHQLGGQCLLSVDCSAVMVGSQQSQLWPSPATYRLQIWTCCQHSSRHTVALVSG